MPLGAGENRNLVGACCWSSITLVAYSLWSRIEMNGSPAVRVGTALAEKPRPIRRKARRIWDSEMQNCIPKGASSIDPMKLADAAGGRSSSSDFAYRVLKSRKKFYELLQRGYE